MAPGPLKRAVTSRQLQLLVYPARYVADELNYVPGLKVSAP
jgi:hypothetical protein